MGPMLAAHWWQLPFEISFAAIAAQNIALVDIRGSYPLRLSLLLVMAAVLAGATWLGSITAGQLGIALGAVVLIMLASGLWRHLSAEYGPSLSTASALLFLIALAHPDGAAQADRHFLAALAGGVLGVLVQGSLWPLRPQPPLPPPVAHRPLALSPLMAPMAPPPNPGAAQPHPPTPQRPT